RDRVPTRRVRVFGFHRSWIERGLQESFELQSSTDQLTNESGERLMLDDDRHAFPRRVLGRALLEVRSGDRVLRAVPFEATVCGMFATHDEASAWPQVRADESDRPRQVGRPTQPINGEHHIEVIL